MEPILSQATGTDETERHAALSGNETLPDVIVLSRYVPSALATKVPVVCKEPVTGTLGQPKLSNLVSMSPDSFRHEDATFQEPTTEPPHGVKGLQLGAPPMPEPLCPVIEPDWPLPPLAVAPPMVGVSPGSLLQPELLAIATSVNETASPKFVCRMTILRSFTEQFLTG
jgi:hypothetical protein